MLVAAMGVWFPHMANSFHIFSGISDRSKVAWQCSVDKTLQIVYKILLKAYRELEDNYEAVLGRIERHSEQ